VVKAMGSAKQGYPVVSRMLSHRAPSQPEPAALIRQLDHQLRAVVHDVIRLTPNIVEVVVRAPIAARAFKPGQFYRLQNYEALAPRTADTVLGWKAWLSPEPRSITKKDCSRPSCSKWAALPISVRF
jgi:hypothetical protein